MQKIGTWLKEKNQDVEMGEQHIPFWLKMIEHTTEPNFAQSTVLDFGCGCGGFLRTLYREKPFKSGYGVDVAEQSVEVANSAKGGLPVNYFVAGSLPDLSGKVDTAFSYEVIYLLPDLQEHAKFIHKALKSGGVYYAVTGCHTANPLWSKWHGVVEKKSSLPVQNYAPEDFVNAFINNGFTASGQQLGYRGLVPFSIHPDYFPTVLDSVNYYANSIIVFRFQKI